MKIRIVSLVAEGRLEGKLTITSDDPANRTLKVSLKGFGSRAR